MKNETAELRRIYRKLQREHAAWQAKKTSKKKPKKARRLTAADGLGYGRDVFDGPTGDY